MKRDYCHHTELDYFFAITASTFFYPFIVAFNVTEHPPDKLGPDITLVIFVTSPASIFISLYIFLSLS